MPDAALTGGCLCGGVRYAISGPLRHASHCHCAMCRRHHGAAFGSYASVSRSDFRFESGANLVGRYASSPGVERGFCTRCGSTLFWDPLENAKSFGVALGSIDGDPGVRPSLHIFVGSKAPWFDLTDDLPRHETSPRAVAAKPT